MAYEMNWNPKNKMPEDEAIAFLDQTAMRYPYDELVSPPIALSELQRAVELARAQRFFRVAVRAD